MIKVDSIITMAGLQNQQLQNKIVDANNCWLFQGALTHDGYGIIMHERVRWLMHRFSMWILRPELYKEQLNVNHKCNVRACFNPEHLYVGNQKQNAADSIKAGTHYSLVNAAKTHCKYGHEFSPKNTKISQGRRRCRICLNKTTRDWNKRNGYG